MTSLLQKKKLKKGKTLLHTINLTDGVSVRVDKDASCAISKLLVPNLTTLLLLLVLKNAGQ